MANALTQIHESELANSLREVYTTGELVNSPSVPWCIKGRYSQLCQVLKLHLKV